MTIATIGIGYADGIHRCLSNIGNVLVNNQRCRIIGNISMDLITVDVTNVNVTLGQEVVIFGKTNDQEITLEELSSQIKSVPYEIITQINPRVKRVYLNRI